MDCLQTGRFIAQLRQEAGLTQKELAARLGVTGSAVSKWERGLCYPDIELVAQMAELFSVRAGDILSGRRPDGAVDPQAEDLVLESVQLYTGLVRQQMQRKLWVVCMGAYGVLLVYALFLRNGFRAIAAPELDYAWTILSGIQLRPFRTIGEYLQIGAVNWKVPASFLLGHVALFLPLGYLLPCRWEKLRHLSRTLVTALLVTVALELIQLFTTLGVFDVDAILLNLAGAALGFALWKATPARLRPA